MTDAVGPAVRIVFPVVGDAARSKVARAAARSRISLRWMFRDKPKYLEAFSQIAPGQSVAAFEGAKVVGLLQVRQGRRDPFILSIDRFCEIWGPIKGRWFWYAYKTHQFFVSMQGVYCSAVWVHPDSRGRGLGASLYQAIIQASDEPVSAMARRNRMAFHQRCGFVRSANPYYRLIGLISGTVPMRAEPRPIKVKEGDS